MNRVAIAALLFGGCATSATGTTVTIELENADAGAVVYRDGTDAWLAAGRIDAHTWQIDVTDDYEVMATCSNGTHQQMLAATVGDGSFVRIPCAAVVERVASPFAITGTLSSGGSVAVQGPATVNMVAPDLSFAVAPTVYPGRSAFADVVATTSDRVQIVRGGELRADVDLGAMAIDTDGEPFGSARVVAVGSELRHVRTVLELDGSQVWSDEQPVAGATARVVPVHDFGARDRETIVVSGDGTFASFELASDGVDALRFDFMERPAGAAKLVDGGVLRAEWTSLPARATRIEATAGELGVTVLHGWLDAHPGATSFAFDTTAPGFDTTRSTATAGASFTAIEERGLAKFWSTPE